MEYTNELNTIEMGMHEESLVYITEAEWQLLKPAEPI